MVVLRLACGHCLLIADLDMMPAEALRREWLCETCHSPSEATAIMGAITTAEAATMTEDEVWAVLLGAQAEATTSR